MSVAGTCDLLKRAGLHWVPVPLGAKAPVERRWQEPKERPVPDHPTNVGVLLIEGSGVVDIDLDSPSAAKAAEVLVDAGPGVVRYGRASKPVSHVLVRQHGPYRGPRRVVDPEARTLLLEVRTNRQQSLVPPSVHPSGEVLRWVDDPEGLVAVGPDQAERLVRWIAAAAVLAVGWDQGSRHHLALATAGWLLRKGVHPADVERFVAAVCHAAGDTETKDRLTAVVGTAERQTEQDTTGFPTLVTLVGEVRARTVARLLFPDKGPKADDPRRGRTKGLTVETVLQALAKRDDLRVLDAGPGQGTVLVWDGTRWQQGAMGLARDPIVRTLDDLGAPEAWYNHTVTLCSHLVRGAVPELIVRETDTNIDPYLLGLPDGRVVDLRTGEVRPARREDMVTLRTGVPYDPKADRSLFLEVLALGAGKEAVEYLQLLAGATLIGGPSKLAVVIHGPTDTGKTLFLVDAFCTALGDYAIQLDPEKVMRTGSDRVELWLSRAVGKRLVVLSEPSQGHRINVALLKAATGRGTVTVRPLYSQPREVTPTWTFWIDTNWKPDVGEIDEAVWNRLRAVGFTTKVRPDPKDPRYDPRFLDRWRTVAPPACLAWAVEGAVRIVREGIDVVSLPRPAADVTAEWQDAETEGSPLEFARDRLEADPKGFVARKEVWEAYCEWAAVRPYARTVNRTTLYEVVGGMYRLVKVDGEWGFRARFKAVPIEGRRALEVFPSQHL